MLLMIRDVIIGSRLARTLISQKMITAIGTGVMSNLYPIASQAINLQAPTA